MANAKKPQEAGLSLEKWLRANVGTDCVCGEALDEDVEAGLGFIERLARRASPYSAEIVFPLGELMEEEGLDREDEAIARLEEMYRKANKLQGRLDMAGLYFNYMDSLDTDSCGGRTVRLGYRFWQLLKYNGFLESKNG